MATPLFRHRSRVTLAVAAIVIVLAATACGPYVYAGDSRAEAKVIGDRYIVQHYPNAALLNYSGMHKAYVLGREAWMLVYTQGPSAVCVYVWWSRYHDDDYAIGRKC